ncbi:MAG TPA: hypothetical protein VGI56_10825, partial [Galbitalea sp.]
MDGGSTARDGSHRKRTAPVLARRVARHALALAVVVAIGLVLSAPVGARERGPGGVQGRIAVGAQLQPEDCAAPRFNVDNGNGGTWVGFVTGVSFVSGDHAEVVFEVDSGYEVTALCVKTQDGLNVPGDYTISPSSFPIVGPTTLTITAAPSIAAKSGIIHVGFTVQPVPPPPVAIVPSLNCVSARAGGGYYAHFGYENPNASTQSIAVGPDNQ